MVKKYTGIFVAVAGYSRPSPFTCIAQDLDRLSPVKWVMDVRHEKLPGIARPSKHDTLNECWSSVGSSSQTMGQR